MVPCALENLEMEIIPKEDSYSIFRRIPRGVVLQGEKGEGEKRKGGDRRSQGSMQGMCRIYLTFKKKNVQNGFKIFSDRS